MPAIIHAIAKFYEANKAFEEMPSSTSKNAIQDLLDYGRTPIGKFAFSFEFPISIALIIISSLGIAGILPGSTLGLSVIGMEVGLLVLHAGGKLFCSREESPLKDHKYSASIILVGFLFSTTFGILGATRVLSAAHIGWALISPSLVLPGGIAIILSCSVGTCCCCCCCGGKIFPRDDIG